MHILGAYKYNLKSCAYLFSIFSFNFASSADERAIDAARDVSFIGGNM